MGRRTGVSLSIRRKTFALNPPNDIRPHTYTHTHRHTFEAPRSVRTLSRSMKFCATLIQFMRSVGNDKSSHWEITGTENMCANYVDAWTSARECVSHCRHMDTRGRREGTMWLEARTQGGQAAPATSSENYESGNKSAFIGATCAFAPVALREPENRWTFHRRPEGLGLSAVPHGHLATCTHTCVTHTVSRFVWTRVLWWHRPQECLVIIARAASWFRRLRRLCGPATREPFLSSSLVVLPAGQMGWWVISRLSPPASDGE